MVREELNLRSVLHIWLSEEMVLFWSRRTWKNGVAVIVSVRWWSVSTDSLAEDGSCMRAYWETEGNLGLRVECLW